MNFLDKIKKLCVEKDISQRTLEKNLNISNGSTSKWAKSTPSGDVLLKLSSYFDVSVDYLLGNINHKKCHTCGLQYLSGDRLDENMHKKYHNAYINALNKYGFYWNSTYREDIKSNARQTLYDNTKDLHDKYLAAVDILKSLFCRSLEASHFDLNHPTFPEYSSMLLKQEQFKKTFDSVYDLLINEFGLMNGISEGTYYYFNNKEDVNNEINAVFQVRLKELRIKKGVPQSEIAEYLGISRQGDNNYELENREPTPDTLIKLSNFFNVSVDYILGTTDNPTPPQENKPINQDITFKQEDSGITLYKQLDTEDKAEIRGTMKQMLKADKYTDEEYFDVYTAAKGHGTQHKKISATDRKAAHEALNAIRDQNKNK